MPTRLERISPRPFIVLYIIDVPSVENRWLWRRRWEWRLAAADRRMMASPGSGGGSHWQATPIAIAVAEDGVGRSWFK